jgi:membrane protein
LFLMFLALYKFVPTSRSTWRAAFWGALAATLLSLLATRLFSWYLNVGLANYELVYGSLGTIVALMFLIYILAWITLLGAHLAACAVPRRDDASAAADIPGSK